MTLAESIIAAHAGRESVSPGELVGVAVDRVYLQDGNTPTVRRLFAENGFTRTFDAARIGVFFDHAVLVPDARMADRLREAESFAAEMGVRVFPAGTGVSHVVALEEGWFQPGSIVVGADSHTCTGGVMQCMALGMGASDVAAAMVTGRTWLRVPETVWVQVDGTPHPLARSRDVVLALLARLGQQPFLYRALELVGSWPATLAPDAAATVANLGVELGCKILFLPPGPGRPGLRPLAIPANAPGAAAFHLNVDGLPPHVSRPHSPADAVPLDECAGERINYVFIGSCTNGRYDDLAEAARVLEGGRVHAGVQCVVTPGSRAVYLRALREGLVERFVEAGALVTPPGCGTCVGTQGPIPASGDRVLATTNRNFKGRMGNAGASIWLGSPLVAAHTALRGRIPSLDEVA
jgi:3-isopropylmalate/(R)-2-methylmalate dehydratase large subunit